MHPNRALPVVQMQEVRRGRREEPRPRPPDGYKRRAGRRGPCFQWNDGRCTHPYCHFEHVSSHCYRDHKRVTCKRGRGEVNKGKESGPPRSYTRASKLRNDTKWKPHPCIYKSSTLQHAYFQCFLLWYGSSQASMVLVR